jgi:hypothetical protein
MKSDQLETIELGPSYPNACLYPDVRDAWRDAAPCASRYPGPGPIGPSDASRCRYRKACDASHLDYVVTVMRHGLLETRYVIEHLDPGPIGVIGLDRAVLFVRLPDFPADM